MATLHVAFGKPGEGALMLMPASPSAAQTITTSGISQASTITATNGDTACVKVSGGRVFIAFGASPTAASNSGYMLNDGDADYFCNLKAGDKIAVIDA